MRNNALAFACSCAIATAGWAQTETGPLSAIDWLSENTTPAARPIAEPPTSNTATSPEISVTLLGDNARKRLGLLPSDVSGLSPDLWTQTDATTLVKLLTSALRQRLPAGQELLITLLLTEADDLAVTHEATAWTTARIEALTTLGAVDPALALVSQADPTSGPTVFRHWMDLSLLSKTESAACQALINTPALSNDPATRIYCTARMGDFDTAALLYGTSAALNELSDTQDALIARFLDPELFGEDTLPRAPLRPDPLTFRLFEAAGAALPTAPLPRVFAHSDLSEDAGWKAQLEAAERLARTGTVSSNRLLGLYTDRKAAASGGIWDRVRALQAFDAALTAKDAKKVALTLPPIWRGMQAADLQTPFADLFATSLAEMDLPEAAGHISFQMRALSRGFQSLEVPEQASPSDRFLVSVAKGNPNPKFAATDIARAVLAGFDKAAPGSVNAATLDTGHIGETLLRVLSKLGDAGRGDTAALSTALADLKELGLEDFARRAALQALVILDAG